MPSTRNLNKNCAEMCDRKPIAGVCRDMCPRREHAFRKKHKLLHMFEIPTNTDMRKSPTSKKAIKQFSRSAAGKADPTAEDLRPSDVLLKTMNYLVEEIVPRTDVPWCTIYDFVNDRIQAIRQDLTIQRIENDHAVQILEKSVRFYLISFYMSCEKKISVFDPYLNNQQITICLERLLSLYKYSTSDHQDEFYAIYCLHHIGSSQTLQYISNLAKNGNSSMIHQARNINLAYITGNFVNFFRIVNVLPIILLLCTFQHLSEVRQRALKAMCSAYNSKLCKFPIAILGQWLSLQCTEVKNLCVYYGFGVENNHVCFQKKDFNTQAEIFNSFQEDFIKQRVKNLSLIHLINGISKK